MVEARWRAARERPGTGAGAKTAVSQTREDMKLVSSTSILSPTSPSLLSSGTGRPALIVFPRIPSKLVYEIG